MDPLGDLVGYLAGLDWLGGVAVGAAALAVAAVIVILIERSAHGPGERWGDVAVATLRRWRDARGRADDTPWRCDRCGSVNPAGALLCYRGCGPRDEVATPIPLGSADDSGAPSQLGGRSRRRG